MVRQELLLGVKPASGKDWVGDFFAGRFAQAHAQRGRRMRGQPSRPFIPKAWALNVLGKSYRLSAELALDLAQGDARWLWTQADRYLHDASKNDPLLPYL